MAQTSLDCWNDAALDAERMRVRNRVLHFLDGSSVSWTACQLAKIFGLPITSVRPRLSDMAVEGVVVEDGTKFCPECNKQNIAYKTVKL